MQNMNGIPLIEHVQIAGPFKATGPGDTPSRRRIFVCRRGGARAVEGRRDARARRRSCRRWPAAPIGGRSTRDLDTLIGFYEAGRKKGTFDAGIENALRFILTSPKFLFRGEPDPPTVAAGAVYPVTDLELASRLSFFLWSSIPDDQLLTLATQGKLKDPAVLERQVRRMLADPRSKALVDNFAAQWLFVRNLQSFLPDTQTFPNFDDNLRQAFRRETELFFESIIREDRNVLDLLTADYTFVNERLARHYGIPNVYGSRFRRVTLPDENRRGLLGQGTRARGDVLSEPHVAGAARQMDSGERPRHAAAAAAAQRPDLAGKRRGRQGRRRSASGWNSTARTPAAPPVTG